MSDPLTLADLIVAPGASNTGYARYATLADLVAVVVAEGGKVMKRATIRDEKGKYQNGDYLVFRIPDDTP